MQDTQQTTHILSQSQVAANAAQMRKSQPYSLKQRGVSDSPKVRGNLHQTGNMQGQALGQVARNNNLSQASTGQNLKSLSKSQHTLKKGQPSDSSHEVLHMSKQPTGQNKNNLGNIAPNSQNNFQQNRITPSSKKQGQSNAVIPTSGSKLPQNILLAQS